MLDLHVVALVLPSTYHYTAASSMVVVRSRPRPCRRSPRTVISRFLLVVDHVDNTGGRRRGERTKAEDDGEASDGNEQELGKITASRGRREQVVPSALVWLWRLEEEETEETRQTLNVNPTVKVGTIVC